MSICIFILYGCIILWESLLDPSENFALAKGSERKHCLGIYANKTGLSDFLKSNGKFVSGNLLCQL